jgi:hypothetical protein
MGMTLPFEVANRMRISLKIEGVSHISACATIGAGREDNHDFSLQAS